MSDTPDTDARDAFLSKLWQIAPAMVAGTPHFKRLGMRFVSIGDGRATLALDYNTDLVGDPASGVMHGGAITTLLDQTAGLASIAGFAKPIGVATLNLHIDYMRPSPPGESVIAVAEAYKLTRHIAFVRGVAHNGDESDPVATCQASFMATPLPGTEGAA